VAGRHILGCIAEVGRSYRTALEARTVLVGQASHKSCCSGYHEGRLEMVSRVDWVGYTAQRRDELVADRWVADPRGHSVQELAGLVRDKN